MRIVKYISLPLLLLSGAMAMGPMISCHKDGGSSPNYNADKSRLKTLIDSLTTVYNNAVEGNKPGDYVAGARAALDSVIQLGTSVYTGKTFTQEQVDNAVSNLVRAGNTFSSQQLQDVSPANLMGFWKFNGNANDSSGNGNNAVPKTNWIGPDAAHVTDGGTLPLPAQDRFGRPNSAYYFDKGATFEVPYKASLNPKSMTISCWLRTDVGSTGGDYVFALDRWWGYKLNLQGSNFLYFTVFKAFDANHNGSWVTDDDGGSGSQVPLGKWVHAAVSYDNANSTVKFYLNGALVRTLTGKTGPPATLTNGYNLTIGNELPKINYNLTDSNNPDYYWSADYFTGYLDDIRFYNIALTDKEVLSIYTAESTLN